LYVHNETLLMHFREVFIVGNVYVFFGALFNSNIFVEEKQTLLPQKTKT